MIIKDITEDEYFANRTISSIGRNLPSDAYRFFINCVNGVRKKDFKVHTINNVTDPVTVQSNSGNIETHTITCTKHDLWSFVSEENTIGYITDLFRSRGEENTFFVFDVRRYPVLIPEKSFNVAYHDRETMKYYDVNPELPSIPVYKIEQYIKYGVLKV